MPASVNIAPAWCMDGPTYNGANLRPIFSGLLAAASIQVMSGVLPGGGAWFVSPGGGMSVSVGSGYGVIEAASVAGGGYLCAAMTSTTLTVAGADPTNPRVDLVCATINDLGSSSSVWLLQVVTGTPTAGATLSNLNGAPSVPTTSLLLAYVLVPAGSSSVTSGNIGDQRVFTTAHGGIIPVPTLAAATANLTAYQGMYCHDRNTLRLFRLGVAGAIVQPQLLPVAPQQAQRTSNLTPVVGGSSVIGSVSVACDGNTDLEIQVSWYSFSIPTTATFGQYGALLAITIDASTIRQMLVPAASNSSGSGGGGGGFTHVTTSGLDRPAAGTHTVAWKFTSMDDGVHPVSLVASSAGCAPLYVRAAPL